VSEKRISIDSNILVYFEGVNDEERRLLADACIKKLDFSNVCIPVQALGEFYRILVRKGAYAPVDASAIVWQWQKSVQTLETSSTAFKAALGIVSDHNFQIWDAIILAVSEENGCKCLLSEDMQDGFVWRGVEIINPLKPDGAARLQQFT
jgi:predicted nucleic acid-binding protein